MLSASYFYDQQKSTGQKAVRSLRSGGTSSVPRPKGRGGQLMSIISLICDLVSAGCAVFGVLFSVYLYKQSHNDDNAKK